MFFFRNFVILCVSCNWTNDVNTFREIDQNISFFHLNHTKSSIQWNWNNKHFGKKFSLLRKCNAQITFCVRKNCVTRVVSVRAVACVLDFICCGLSWGERGETRGSKKWVNFVQRKMRKCEVRIARSEHQRYNSEWSLHPATSRAAKIYPE